MIKNLKYLREKHGYSQEALAYVLKLSQQSIAKYETTETQPDLDTLVKLAKLFGTSVDFLIGASETEELLYSGDSYAFTAGELHVMECYRAASSDVKDLINYAVSRKTSDPDKEDPDKEDQT